MRACASKFVFADRSISWHAASNPCGRCDELATAAFSEPWALLAGVGNPRHARVENGFVPAFAPWRGAAASAMAFMRPSLITVGLAPKVSRARNTRHSHFKI